MLREVARFNLCLALPSSVHRRLAQLGWADALTPSAAGIWRWPAAQAAVSAALLDTLQHPPCFDPRRPEWPLALLSEQALDDFCCQLAAVLMHRRVRQTLSRDDVLRWRHWLGPSSWRLAMEGAALLPALPPTPAVDPEQTTARDLGLCWLWRASAHWDPAIAERWRLRQDPVDLGCATDVPAERAHRTAMSVLSAVHPRWFSRFAR